MASHMLGAVVAAPPLVRPPVNLLQAARNPRDPDGTNWQSGITYRPALNYQADGYSQCGTSSTMPTGAKSPAPTITWQPVIQVASKVCSTIGWAATDWRQELTDLLDVDLPKFVEAEFWTGALAQKEGLDNLWLASTHATDVTPGSIPSIRRGMQELEAALASYGAGARGIIHMPRRASQDFTKVQPQGNLLVTPDNNIVVPGVGYLDTDRSGAAAAAGTTWLYATGLVDVRIDKDIAFFPDAEGQPGDIDRATNTGVLRAERNVLVSWDGLVHFACHVNLDA